MMTIKEIRVINLFTEKTHSITCIKYVGKTYLHSTLWVCAYSLTSNEVLYLSISPSTAIYRITLTLDIRRSGVYLFRFIFFL